MVCIQEGLGIHNENDTRDIVPQIHFWWCHSKGVLAFVGWPGWTSGTVTPPQNNNDG